MAANTLARAAYRIDNEPLPEDYVSVDGSEF